MKKQSKIAVLVGLSLIMILINGYYRSSETMSFSESFWAGTGASIVSIPLWIAVGGFALFGGIIWILNLSRKDNKLIYSPLDKSIAGVTVGIILKFFFTGVP